MYNFIKLLIERGRTEGLAHKAGVFYGVGQLTEDEYTEIMGLLNR